MSIALRLLTRTAALASLCCATAVWSQAPTPGAVHEQQLQAIRQALLEATLDKPTQIISSAWVDDRGALHESHEFHSQAEVRGVRVLSYLNDGEEPKARVSAEVLPWNWRQHPTAQAGCAAPPRPWRLPMAIVAQLDSGFSGQQKASAQSLLSSAQTEWRSLLLQAERWTPAQWHAPAPNTYLHALQSPPDADAGGWMTLITLRPTPGLQHPWYDPITPWPTAAAWRWTLELQVGQRASARGEFKPASRHAFELTLDPLAMAQPLSLGQQSLLKPLLQGLMQAVQQLQGQTRCEPVQFRVQRHDGHPALRLQAGQDSGLRPGDRVLLMQPGWVPGRLLDPRSAEHLALAEVVQTGQRHTEIRQLAGPPLAHQGEWVALPL